MDYKEQHELNEEFLKVFPLEKLKEMIATTGSHALIEVDGGVNHETSPRLVKAGANVLVSGSYVFKATDPIATIKALKMLKD